MHDVSLFRLYLMRAAYLLMLVGLGVVIWPVLLAKGPQLEHMHGVVCAMLCTLSILSALGLRYPLKMLPVLLFELAWKTMWMLCVPLPLWLQGVPLEPGIASTVFDNTLGLIVVPLVIPWGYVWRQYVVAPGDAWRRKHSPHMKSR